MVRGRRKRNSYIEVIIVNAFRYFSLSLSLLISPFFFLAFFCRMPDSTSYTILCPGFGEKKETKIKLDEKNQDRKNMIIKKKKRFFSTVVSLLFLFFISAMTLVLLLFSTNILNKKKQFKDIYTF
jgi:uncharacterized BrkB/YihY/UPF0761 family membrane protein